MATNVIMPALGMAQETGTLVRWLKAEGAQVAKGEPLAEIMTDKATVELEAPADGLLADVTAAEGEEVPVGRVIATVLPAEASPTARAAAPALVSAITSQPASPPSHPDGTHGTSAAAPPQPPGMAVSPLASRIAAEHRVDWSAIPATGRRIQKADVLSYLSNQQAAPPARQETSAPRLAPASPKARRLASQLGKDVAALKGSGPGGAVLTADVLAPVAITSATETSTATQTPAVPAAAAATAEHELSVTGIWRLMAERTTQSWRDIPHFFLVREVNASRLVAWREHSVKRSGESPTYTDLLIRIIAAALRAHQRVNASWRAGSIVLHPDINIGLAIAVEEGLVVPVIHWADQLDLHGIAWRRTDLAARARAGKLRPEDVSGGTFTISNLGMYGVDAFNAIVPAPQAAILAVGRIVERVVPVKGTPAVQPMMTLSLSCDHRVVDGARAAQFLGTVAELIEEPLALLE
jgi:pyruvate dehydrogenase E2 component (dihydrolipoamide acetyltransferase)